MSRFRRLVVLLLVALLPAQGALASSKLLCASMAAAGATASADVEGGSGHRAGPAAHDHAAHDHAAHGHAAHAEGDAATHDDAPPAGDDGRSCKLCAACSLAAAVTFVEADLPHAQPDGAVDAPPAPAVPRGRAERLERPPKSA